MIPPKTSTAELTDSIGTVYPNFKFSSPNLEVVLYSFGAQSTLGENFARSIDPVYVPLNDALMLLVGVSVNTA